MYEVEASTFALFPENCILPDEGRPECPKHVAVLIIKRRKKELC
jgi:hypothetical protein